MSAPAKTVQLCSVDTCGREHHAHGFCHYHMRLITQGRAPELTIETATRHCISCRKPFRSRGPFHRRCNGCKQSGVCDGIEHELQLP